MKLAIKQNGKIGFLNIIVKGEKKRKEKKKKKKKIEKMREGD